MAKKIYTVLIQKLVAGGTDQCREKSGTLDELNSYFSKKASKIGVLINQVQKSYAEREACCYNRTHISLKKD